mgnify:CR=1 FL=1
MWFHQNAHVHCLSGRRTGVPSLFDFAEMPQDILEEMKPNDAGTPTVFDNTTNEVVDIGEEDWLDQLVQSN